MVENKFLRVGPSNIPNADNGLYAKVDFKKGQLIAEYRGQICRKKDMPKEYNKSIVAFNDDTYLYCDKDDLASYANDCIQVPKVRRKLIEALKTKKPFYDICANVSFNASIRLVHRPSANRAFLKAEMDIKAGDEICTHYGFDYWFTHECDEFGFNPETDVEKYGFPDDITRFVGFKLYIAAFYPGGNFVRIGMDACDIIYTIKFDDGTFIDGTVSRVDRTLRRISVAEGIQHIIAKAKAKGHGLEYDFIRKLGIV